MAKKISKANGIPLSGGSGGGATNLGYTPSPTNGIVTSDTGTDATIPLADGTNAGLLKPAKYTVLENTSNTNSGDETNATIKSKLEQSTTSTDGWLSSIDWNTFNGKQNSFGYTPANKAGETFTGNISATNLSGSNTGDQDLSSLAPKDSPTFTTKTTHSYATANSLASFNGSKELISLGSTYPTLAEMALLKDLSVVKIKITTSISITTSTLDASNYSQNGKTVIIDNGVNAINITINSELVASYLKKGTGAVTFVQGSGRTLVQVDDTSVLDGAVGSTASITSDGTTDYLRISNS